VTTLLFLGSTAPTATSGVSTIATIFGGAVNIAACPNLIANVGGPPGAIEAREVERLILVDKLNRGAATLDKLDLPFLIPVDEAAEAGVAVAKEIRR
jgi:hypothetical protein